MEEPRTHVVQTLVSEEVRRIVADAVGDGQCVSAYAAAGQIMRAYPNCGMSEPEIVEEILSAAAAAGVAVERRSQSMPDPHAANGSEFGTLYAQSEAMYATLDDFLAGTSGPVDPTEMTRRLSERIPQLKFEDSELELVVVNAAKAAGLPVKRHSEAGDRSRNSGRDEG